MINLKNNELLQISGGLAFLQMQCLKNKKILMESGVFDPRKHDIAYEKGPLFTELCCKGLGGDTVNNLNLNPGTLAVESAASFSCDPIERQKQIEESMVKFLIPEIIRRLAPYK